MPIRLNLLAEQQALEEQRRRDPVKRAIWVGAGLVSLMLLWVLSLQFDVHASKTEIVRLQEELRLVEENSKESRANWAELGIVERRLANLANFSTNRFFWGTVLDALQRVTVEDIRLVGFQSAQTYITNAETRIKTNVNLVTLPPKSWWKFWSPRLQTNLLVLVTNQFAVITNRPYFATNPVPLKFKHDISTNKTRIVAKLEVIKPITTTEQISLTLRGRDYSSPSGSRIAEYYQALTNTPYFRTNLHPVLGSQLKRSIQPEIDPTDPIQPGRQFISFSIDCRFIESMRANE